MKKINIVALIPARSGSKRLKNKNIRLINGKPLIAYSVIQALKLKDVDYVIVSTDSKKYAKIAEKYGAKYFYTRPKKISGDYSSDLDTFKFNENWLNNNLNYKTDIYIHLRPTFPNRDVKDIKKMLNILKKNYKDLDSIRSVIKIKKSLEKYYKIDKKGFLINNYGFKRLKSKNNYDYMCNQADQLLPNCYIHDGAIDIFKARLLKKNTVSGKKVFAYLRNDKETFDINNLNDFKKTSKKMKK